MSNDNVDGSGTSEGAASVRSTLLNWCKPSAAAFCCQLTDVRFVKPVKSKVWNVNGGLDDVTVNDSLIVPPLANVPVNVTVGAGSNAKCRARSIDSSENASRNVTPARALVNSVRDDAR